MSTADTAFAIGADHIVCEDYALAHSGRAREPSFVALADGCSSSMDTDIGARLLCHAAARRFKLQARALRANPALSLPEPFSPEAIVQDANAWRSLMRLPEDSLDATVAVIYESPGGAAEVRLVGDGVVAARRRDGSGIDHVEVTCSHNAPPYLSYLVKGATSEAGREPLAAYQAAGGGLRHICQRQADRAPLCSVDRVWTTLRPGADGVQSGLIHSNLTRSGEAPSDVMPSGSTQAGSTQAGSTQAGSTQADSTQTSSTHPGPLASHPTSCGVALAWHFAPEIYDVVAVMSDGVSSFRRISMPGPTHVVASGPLPVSPAGSTAVPLQDVLLQLMDFKTVTGGFVKRRLRRFMTRFCITHGWRNFDDVAIGAMALDAGD